MEDSTEFDHDAVADHLRETLDWPQYFVSGAEVDETGELVIDKDDFVPAYYRVEGPNGPVSYMNPNSGPYPTTMYDFAMEAQSESFQWCEREDTPWADDDSLGEQRGGDTSE